MLNAEDLKNRAGRFIRHTNGYHAFHPAPLPPVPALVTAGSLDRVHAEAQLELGRLDGVIGILPNPDLFLAMYVRKEALLSSQIEGTQASLTDVLQFEFGEDADPDRLVDVEEVVNYVKALNFGLERLDTLPVSLRLLSEVHALLLQGVRGKEKSPGDFRRYQNWIGGPSPADAVFVPPPPEDLMTHLGAFEKFLHDDDLPPLVHAGLAHAQFESIHPFYDGNGRVGRLLITLLLCSREVLSRPLLYLSLYLKQHKQEYCDRLQAIRVAGQWEPWVEFFLRGVRDVARASNESARSVLALRESHRELIAKQGKAAGNMQLLHDALFKHPMFTVNSLSDATGMAYETVNKAVRRLEELGLLQQKNAEDRRNRVFTYKPYLDIFIAGTQQEPDEIPPGSEQFFGTRSE